MTFDEWYAAVDKNVFRSGEEHMKIAYAAGAEQMRERAAQGVRDWFDENKDCDCGAPVRKYNTENGHAMNCSFYEGLQIVGAIQSLPVGESSRAPEGTKP